MPDPPLVEYEDDPLLDGDVGLLRRISSEWVDFDDFDEDGRPALKGMAFQLQTKRKAKELGYPSPCLSLGSEATVIAQCGTVEGFVDGLEGYGIARLTAAQVRASEFGLQEVAEPKEPWHVAAFPIGSNSRARRAQGELAIAAELVLVPTPR